jgi:predicted nuclease with RNAse H fold
MPSGLRRDLPARGNAIKERLREQVVRIAETYPDRRDLFLCHAWADRQGAALDLYNHLVGLDVKVWFS